ncbi:MAG: NAD-dependent epimerase/dehydratase family protein [Bacteriovoracia bacterium]
MSTNENIKKTVWVTGATGDVGRHLSSTLESQGYDVIRWGIEDFDLTNFQSVVRAFETVLREKGEPTSVFHCAAYVEFFRTEPNPAYTCMLNELGTIHLIKALEVTKIRPWFCYVSSGHAYIPKKKPERIPEDGGVLARSAYALSKHNAENWTLLLCERAGIPNFCPRVFSITAPWQKSSFVVPRLAELISKASANDAVSTGWLGGSRDFLDIRDVSAALVAAMDHRLTGFYNVCSGEGREIREVAHTFLEFWQAYHKDQKQPVLKEGQPRPDDVEWLVGDPTKLQKATGFKPLVPWRQTLLEVWESKLRFMSSATLSREQIHNTLRT